MTHPETLIAPFETPLGLSLRFLDVPIRVLTNDPAVWSALRSYYAAYAATDDEPPVAVVRLIQGEVHPDVEFVDIERGRGRKVKEAVRDVPHGRLILKRSTGVVMGLWPGHACAVGDLRANLNQGINLINACYAKAILRRGHLLLHASGVSWNGRAAVLAGPPGAGKSTAALHLVEEGFRFLSNDRVLAKPRRGGVEALGYPKKPRVNPGTLLHHPRLSALLDPDAHARLSALAPAALWELERKRDVDLEAFYGPDAVELCAEMQALVLLKWHRDGQGFAVRRLEVAEALANLPLFRKDLGVFDLDCPARPGRSPERAVDRLSRFADLLGRVRVVEITGRTDFAALVDAVGDLLFR
jgi:HprK-related kinase B